MILPARFYPLLSAEWKNFYPALMLLFDFRKLAVLKYQWRMCVCSFQVIKSTEEFEKALKKMQFLKVDTTDLLKYARNVNSHFANKKCQDVIVAARNLMTSEIHNTVKVLLLHCPVFH